MTAVDWPTPADKPWLREWQIFSRRYGVARLGQVLPQWAHRHDPAWSIAVGESFPDDLRRCDCNHGRSKPRCVQLLTQEDGLCDECRTWCVSVEIKPVIGVDLAEVDAPSLVRAESRRYFYTTSKGLVPVRLPMQQRPERASA